MWNYSKVQNKSQDWATEPKKIWSVKKPLLLCCEHGMKATDVCSPKTTLPAPLATLHLQRSALLSHPSAYIKLTSCRGLRLMETYRGKTPFHATSRWSATRTDEVSASATVTRWQISTWTPRARKKQPSTTRALWASDRRMHGHTPANVTHQPQGTRELNVTWVW